MKNKVDFEIADVLECDLIYYRNYRNDIKELTERNTEKLLQEI